MAAGSEFCMFTNSSSGTPILADSLKIEETGIIYEPP
jgi:hypothetical protein